MQLGVRSQEPGYAGKDMNTEAEESIALGAITKLCMVTTQQTEKTVYYSAL
jgi:hypothetical protein